MSENIELAKELHEYTKIIGSHNLHIQGVASKLVENLKPVELNENQLIVLETLQLNANQGIGGLIVNGIDYLQFSEKFIIEDTSQKELFQVLAAFAEWGLQNEPI